MQKEKEGKAPGILREFFSILASAAVLTILINTFICRLYFIPSGSMEPYLLIGDRIVATKFSYWTDDPARGDIVIFKFPPDKRQTLVKRVIGLPGEKVAVKDNQVYINDQILNEPYLSVTMDYPDYGPVSVPEGQYFMMGDNRSASSDSRVWGMLPRELVVGKAVFRYWPWNRFSPI